MCTQVETIGDAYLATTNLLKEQVITKWKSLILLDTVTAIFELCVQLSLIAVCANLNFEKAGHAHHDDLCMLTAKRPRG